MIGSSSSDASGISDPGPLGKAAPQKAEPRVFDDILGNTHSDPTEQSVGRTEHESGTFVGHREKVDILDSDSSCDDNELESTRMNIDHDILADHEDEDTSLEVISQAKQDTEYRKVALVDEREKSKKEKKQARKMAAKARKKEAAASELAKKGGGDNSGVKGASVGKGMGSKRNLSHTGVTPEAKRSNAGMEGTEDTPEGGEPVPKKQAMMSWAEVIKKAIPMFRIVADDPMRDLDQADYDHVSQCIMDLQLDMYDGGISPPEVPVRNGLQDGMILIAMSSIEAVERYRELVPKIVPRTPGGYGYKYLAPGQLPYRLFLARTSDARAAKEHDRFENGCKLYTPGLRGGLFKVVRRVFPKTLEDGKPMGTVGLLLKVGEGLLPVLEGCNFRLPMALTTVRLEAWRMGPSRDEDGTHEEAGGEGENMDHE